MSGPQPPAGDPARHALPSGLLHDLRTPLGHIIGYSEMLREQAHAGGHQALVPDLDKVCAAGSRMLSLIDAHFYPEGPDGPDGPAARGAPAPEGGGFRLGGFILANREPILAEWEDFARTCTPAGTSMDIAALRDHANEILTVIAADLATPESAHQQAEKSRGLAVDPDPGATTAAEAHGAGRAESGFTVEQMVAEFRALRASVVRLWTASGGTLQPRALEDLTRFNEAIDQALAESITRYTEDLDHSREMFLAILGHDLRTPLGAVLTSAQFMLETGDLQEPHLTLTSRIAATSTRMVRMIGDLLDLTRSRLGAGIPVACAPMSMNKVAREVVDEVTAAHPLRTITLQTDGDTHGEWDAGRIGQVLANLLGNALQHGSEGTLVTVDVQGREAEVSIAVHNRGPAIAPEQRTGMFQPMKNAAAGGPGGSLGLGLYIADRIVSAHRGRITVESSEEAGTTFTVHLPRA